MAASTPSSVAPDTTKSGRVRSLQKETTKKNANSNIASKPDMASAEEFLPPLLLVFIVLFCSGFILIFAFRDLLMTGRNIFGPTDEAFLLFTKSTDWFDDSKGWKSTQGGFSAVEQVSTDANNMGGFFVRKMAGAAVAGVQLQKMIPLLFHPTGAQWALGHFRPLLISSVVVDLSVVGFLAFVAWEDLVAGGAAELPRLWIAALVTESLVMLYYIVALSRGSKRGPAVALKGGKTPSSVVSRIVSRTILIVSSAMALIAGRDLFFSGRVMEFIPRDDIYLEWTNALRHSPPPGSEEAIEHGLESPLFVGDKFVSQFMALHVLLLCLYKFVSAYGVRYRADGRGEVQTKMFWKVQAVANAMILFLFRLFTPAAGSASLDLRWHLTAIAYETFLLGLYGFSK